ncbi:MAG: hypothetical protein ABJD97_04140 [Betaproteobacteria bacterium]
MLTLIPKIFYADREVGLDLFVDGLGFKVMYEDATMTVIERDGAKAYIVESAEYAAKDRPEIALETDAIEQYYADISTRRPDLLHPNLSKVTQRPWGAREFALLDSTAVCVVFRQW